MAKPNSVISFLNGPKEVSLYYGGIMPTLPNPFIATVVRLSGSRFSLFRYSALDIFPSNCEFRLAPYKIINEILAQKSKTKTERT